MTWIRLPPANVLWGTQLLILGCLIFLVLVQFGSGEKQAFEMMFLLWLAGILVFVAPTVELIFKKVRGDTDA